MLQKYQGTPLEELFNVSQVSLSPAVSNEVRETSSSAKPLRTEIHLYADVEPDVDTADGQKCERCWRYYDDDGPNRVQPFGDWPVVCGRCRKALDLMGYNSLTYSPEKQAHA